MNRVVMLWLMVGVAGFCLLPWYVLEEGPVEFRVAVRRLPVRIPTMPALFLLLQGEKLWLSPLLLPLLAPVVVLFP